MFIHVRFILLIILFAGSLAGGCGSFSPDGEPATSLPPVAMAQFEFPGVYSALGTTTFTGYPDGVKVIVDVTGIEAGSYSIRILEAGECSPYELGLPDDLPPHIITAGQDIGTLEVAESGHGRLEVFVSEITVVKGPAAVVGRTVALFELSEEGDPGSRHACGVIRLMPAPEPGDVVAD